MWRGSTGGRRGIAVAAALLATAACRSGYHVPKASGGNASPFASAGTGSTYLVGTTITLDASGSYDPDGQIESYQWKLADRPPSSSAEIAAPTAPTTQVVLDWPGTYKFDLTVTDDQGATATSSVTEVADGPAVMVDAGSNASVAWRQNVQLAGSVQVENDIPATVHWSFASRPAKSSAVIAGDSTLAPSFMADAEGDYVVQLTASTVYGSATASVTITSTATRDVIAYPIVAATYSTALDRFVLAGSSPPALHVHDPETGDDVAIPLVEAPTAVSLEPTGLRAAVGHNRMVSIVDLQTDKVVSTHTVPLVVGDLAFGNDARVHCAASGMSFSPIYTLDLATGTSTAAAQQLYTEDTKVRLAPNGTSLYVYDGYSGWYYRYDATTDPVTYVRQVRSAGGVPWFIQGGAAFVGGGAVYWASDDPALDMEPKTALVEPSGPTIDSVYFVAAVDSSATGTLATVGNVDYVSGGYLDAVLNLYDDQTFALGESILIPDTPYQGTTYKNKAQLVAYRSDGSKVYVLTNAAPVHAIYGVVP